MKLSEAIEALFQGAKITKSNGSWGKDYIHWDQIKKRLLNNRADSYNAPLSSLMLISQNEGDCWAIAKEEIKFKDVPIGKLFKHHSVTMVKTEQYQNYRGGNTNYINIGYPSCHHLLDDNELVEYPLTTATP